MIYIKLNDDLTLTVTVNETIHAGDNMSQKITFLVPPQINEVDVQGAYVYLSYVCADGSSDMVNLKRLNAMYNQAYYQYQTQVTCRLSKYPGEVRLWLNITAAGANNCDCPISITSGQCVLHIEGREIPECCGSDRTLIALTQMQADVDAIKRVQEELDVHSLVQEELENFDFDPILDPLVNNAIDIAIADLDNRYDLSGSAIAVQDTLNAEIDALSMNVASDIYELQSMIRSIDSLPVVTSQDNGKFMRVIDGHWTADSVVDVSQEGM